MEFWRKKNADTRLVFPIQKNDGTFITGAAGLDSEYALLGAHGAAAPSFGDCTYEAAEIGTTGIYYLDVQAAEINDDAAVIQVKSSTTGAVVQVLLIRTTAADANTMLVEGADATDTVQACANAAIMANNLDHLCKTATAAADMTTEVVDNSILSRILGNGDTSTFVPSTDGLRALETALNLALKLLRNKVVTDPATGVQTLYDDNSTTALYTANIYKDVAGTEPFDGTGANRRDRLA